MFNEATEALGDKYPSRTGTDTNAFKPAKQVRPEETPLGRALTRKGPWVVDGKHKPIHFHIHGRASGPWGVGTWSIDSTAPNPKTGKPSPEP